MEARQVIEEILSKVFKWHRFPVSLKAEAVLLYFKGLSLRAVREFLLHKGYKVSIETIREWFHAVGRALQAICTTAIWVYVDETKIKARDRTYYLWLAVDEKGLPVFVHLSRRRDAWTAKLVLYNTKAKGCTTDKGPWYVSAVKGLAMEWEHETFGKRNVVERWFFYIKHGVDQEKKKTGRPPKVSDLQLCALFILSYITNTPVFTLAKSLIDPNIKSYHLFRKTRTQKVYRRVCRGLRK